MITDDLYIDGVNAYTRYGVFVTDGGYKSLVCMPPLKEVESNDWWEEDGVEVDLSAPVLNTRDLTLSFACVDGDFEGFMAALKQGAYHIIKSKEIGREYKLRYTQQASIKQCNGLIVTSAKFNDDFPLRDYTYVAPSSSWGGSNDCSLDGISLATYGVRVLAGTLDSIVQKPQVKSNLLRNIKTQSGVIYDGEKAKYKSQDIKINCLMRATNLTELWRNWDALLYNLTQPGERELVIAGIKDSIPCYYRKCSVSEFLPTGRPWLEFTLQLTATNNYYKELIEVFLASENGDYIITEDGYRLTIKTRDNG